MWKKLGIFTIFGLLLLSPLASFALEKTSAEVVFVAQDQVINQNYYAAGQTIEIYGTINGDLFLAASNVTIDSENINGDIFVVAESVNIKNKVNGNLRVIAKQVDLSAEVSGSVFLATNNFIFNEDAVINKHLTFWGTSASLHGQVIQHLEGGAKNIVLDGEVGQGVDLYLSPTVDASLQVTSKAVINGDSQYQALNQADISEGAQINGQLNFQKWTEHKKAKTFASGLWAMLISFFGMLIVGMITFYFLPKVFSHNFSTIKNKTWKIFLFGLLFLVITPILSAALMFTIIGIPLALIMISLWLIGLYLAKILAAWLVGKFIKEKWLKKYHWSELSVLALGIVIYLLLMRIPVVGWLVVMIIYLMAWGLLWYKLKIKK